MILTNKRIRCNECGYEEPNNYYFGVTTWYFVKSNKDNYHFCGKECSDNYAYDCSNDERFLHIEKVKSNSEKMREILA